jgi:mono/diheme cytochrome c family protein
VIFRFPICILLVATLVACRRDMANQPKAKPMSESEFFADGTNARPLPAHVVPRGAANRDEAVETGLINDVYATQLPVKLTPQLLARGRESYDAFCSMCHGRIGDGQGIVVQRGFPAPPSYHIDRLRNAPIGHFYDVMTNGYGTMTSYASQIEPRDRWAIAAYIRALQLSQNSKATDLPPDVLVQLQHQP